jgi:ribosomal protein L9
MKLLFVFTGFMLLAAPLLAETYSWVDEKGTYNFTEDYSRIPQKYRNSVQKRDGMENPSAPAESTSAGTAAPAESAATSSAGTGKADAKAGVSDELFGGKTRRAWQKELTAAQNEVNRREARVKELEAQLKNAGAYNVTRAHAEQQQQYLDAMNDYNKATARFVELLDAARKAGLSP